MIVVNAEYLEKACKFIKERIRLGEEEQRAISWAAAIFSINFKKLKEAWEKFKNDSVHS